MSQSKAQLTNPLGIVNITDGVNVTGVITATTLIGDGTALTGIALTGNINTSGIITASEFYGYGGDLDNVGLGTEDSINTTGIITASAFYGDGSGLTGIGGDLTPLTFTPSNGSTDVGLTTNISILFNKSIQAGVGTITLRTDSATGTIVESYDISSSDRLTISAGTLTIDPTDSLSGLTTYFTVIPAGVLQDTYGVDSNTAIDTYSFTTVQLNYELYAWGLNDYGQLGQNDRTNRSSPVQIPGSQWSFTNEDSYRTLVTTKSDGTLWTWANNQHGQLGQNNKTYYSSPVQIPGTQWNITQARGVGVYAVAAIKTDGTLWSWGYNLNGWLGQNNKTPYSSPVQIPGTEWTKITSGYAMYATFATKSDNTLWSWGRNNNGQLGQNNTVDRSSPVQIPGTQWNYIDGGRGHMTAIKTDGTLWSWGYNTKGQLGQNNRAYYSSPIQIPGTQWGSVGAGNDVTLAYKNDGTLWIWGRNNVGELGQNNRTYYSSPVQIPGTQWSSTISFGYWSGKAIKTDGTLWSWGYNTYGQLAQNDVVRYSSPVQIPGTQWTFVGDSTYMSSAIKQV